MSDESERIFAESVAGIKSVRKRQKLEKFSDVGIFADVSEDKIYVPGRGIVHSLTESIITFDCGHIASRENYGGTCEHGHVVCRDCLILCAYPGCFKRLCTVRGCSRKIVHGEMFCKFHGYMELFFPSPITRRRDEREE